MEKNIDSAEVEINNIINNSLAELTNNSSLLENKNMMDINNEINNGIINNAEEENKKQIEEEDTASIEIFNTALHQYLRINEEIKSLMIAIKERNNIKRKLSDTLSNYLKAQQIKKVNLDGSYKGKRLEVEVKTSNTGFNKTTVTEAILSELDAETELFDKIMRAISKTSIIKEVWKLKVIDEKTTQNNKKIKGRRLDTSMADAAALIENDI